MSAPFHVRHERARTVGCARTVSALSGRPPWSVRQLCAHAQLEPDRYDVEAALAQLAQAPDVVLLTAAEAERYLGIPAGRVRVWATRGRIAREDRNELGQPIYPAHELAQLAGSGS